MSAQGLAIILSKHPVPFPSISYIAGIQEEREDLHIIDKDDPRGW